MNSHTCLVNGLSLMPPLSGVGRVVFELSRRIFRPGGIWSPLYYYGYYSHGLMDLEAPDEAGDNFKRRIFKSALSVVRSNYILKRAARMVVGAFAAIGRPEKNAALLYWEPNHVILEALEAKHRLLTIHDLSCMLHPQWHPRERLDFFNAHFLPGVEKADLIVTDSNVIRHEVMDILRIPELRLGK